MSDPREEFEIEMAEDGDFTKEHLEIMRAVYGGYHNSGINMAYRGWHLAKTQRIRQALRGGNLTSPYRSSPWRNHAASGMRPALHTVACQPSKPKCLPKWREYMQAVFGREHGGEK